MGRRKKLREKSDIVSLGFYNLYIFHLILASVGNYAGSLVIHLSPITVLSAIVAFLGPQVWRF